MYDVGSDYGVNYAGTLQASFNSGPLGSIVSFMPSLALLPPSASPFLPPPPPPPPVPPPPLPPLIIGADGQVAGCPDPEAANYNPLATLSDNTCIYRVSGCMDPLAINFIPTAEVDDGTCFFAFYGCSASMFQNYNPTANVDDGTCEGLMNYGCTDSTKLGFNMFASIDDGSCRDLVRAPLPACRISLFFFSQAHLYSSTLVWPSRCTHRSAGA